MYRRKHDAEIYAAMQKDLFSKFKDEAYMKKHNPRPLNQKPEGEDKPKLKSDSGDKVMGAFGLK